MYIHIYIYICKSLEKIRLLENKLTKLPHSMIALWEIYIYIYIYREREIQKYICVSIYIYIRIYVEKERERERSRFIYLAIFWEIRGSHLSNTTCLTHVSSKLGKDAANHDDPHLHYERRIKQMRPY